MIDLKKRSQAERILASCVGTEGVWAAADRYDGQCWTRDLAQAALEPMLDRGQGAIVLRHAENLRQRQKPNGQIPILFLDGLMGHAAFLRQKIEKSVRDRKLSFMLGRYLRGQLGNLTPGTRDSEIHYAVLVGEIRKRGLVPHSDWTLWFSGMSALRYVEENLTVDGLVTGADWRDTMQDELANAPLLTNNCVLYRALLGLDQLDRARRLRERILSTYFLDDAVLDYPGNPRFDPLGGAFSVLFGIAGPEHYPALIRGFREVDSPLGVTIKCRHNPTSDAEREIIERTDGVVVWPFVVGYAVLALLKMGETGFALEQLAKLRTQKGFYEWYDPETGAGCGAKEQMWSAALYLQARDAL